MRKIYLHKRFDSFIKIHKLLTDENNLIFISLISYIYLSSEIVYYFVLKDNHITEVLEVSLCLLIFQIFFAILAYIVRNY